jgi:hypothetical protein
MTPDDWRVYAKTPTVQFTQGGLLIGEKLFEWIVVPASPGVQTIPPFEFSYFDPQTAAYRTLSTLPLPLEVLPGDSQMTELVSAGQNLRSRGDPLPLKPLNAAEDSGEIYPQAGFWLLWLGAPAAAAGGWVWVYHQRRVQEGLVRLRRARALHRARRRESGLQVRHEAYARSAGGTPTLATS